MIGTKTLAQQAHPQVHYAPLSSHPGFAPAFILWCAALLGLPVLAISGAALESCVIAAKIDTMLPAAAPPLGATARLLLAAGFAALGAAIGWLVARMLRPAPACTGDEIQRRQRDSHPDHPARRPISAHAELGDEGLGSVRHERDLFPEDLTPYRSYAPTPAPISFPQEPAPYHMPVFAAPSVAQPVYTAPTVAHEPVMAGNAAEAYDLPEIDFSGLTDSPVPAPAPSETEAEAAGHSNPPLTLPPLPDGAEDDWHALPPVVSETDLRRTPARPLSPVPAPVVPLHPNRRAVEKAPAEKPASEPPAMIGATPVQPRGCAGERISHASLGDLSHVELIERLAMAIHTREKTARPVAVNDGEDPAAPEDKMEDESVTQASLRSALAGLREVK